MTPRDRLLVRCSRVTAGVLVAFAAGLLASIALVSSGGVASAAYYGYCANSSSSVYYCPPTTTAPPLELLVGDDMLEPAVDQNIPGRAEVFSYIAVKTGTVTEIRLYVDATSTGTSLVLGLYADNGSNRAGTLLTQGSRTGLVNGTWNTVTVPGAPVTAGVKYWLAILAPAGDGTIRFRDHCCGQGGPRPSENSKQTTLTTLPATWTSGKRWPVDGPASLAGFG
jgi:hypothetical protein